MAQDDVHRIENPQGDVGVLSYAPLDPAAIEESLRNESDGAVVSFVGYTRDNFQGRKVTHLTYEAYIPLALKTLAALFAEARALPPPEPFSHAAPHACCARSGPHSHAADHDDASPPRIELGRMHVAHLVGPSPPRTPSIVVAVSSPHRREAFFVAEWMLERVKERVQVWKREWYADEDDEAVREGLGAGQGEDGRREPGFVGRDGEGPHGMGGRAHAKWKENFPHAVTAKAGRGRAAGGEGAERAAVDDAAASE
ncbi:hypothetical protein JCM3775_003885 [Rhodotorula graminis]|uniref:Uncharacterized protein n=1 Tax=Rhodotorula graminis (strain WP1) TaxID=578459 RepID=A0A194SAZ3_RHOGW|nr:uncharacterized protein RHOBADRAFT_32489 [Rhodotorula graminis WP1]KPV77893.1 hypothetical protein RHOBADRAFT_32489 [Rhodotorula graminis WP1]